MYCIVNKNNDSQVLSFLFKLYCIVHISFIFSLILLFEPDEKTMIEHIELIQCLILFYLLQQPHHNI